MRLSEYEMQEIFPQENHIMYGMNGTNIYIVLRLIGRGSFGAVFEVVQVPPNIKLPETGTTPLIENTQSSLDQKKPKEKKKATQKKSGSVESKSLIGKESVIKPDDNKRQSLRRRRMASKAASGATVAKRYAVKCEPIDKLHNLKAELALLKVLKERNGRHFCTIVDRAKTDTYKFIVMTLTGDSLATLRKERPDNAFSLATALRVGIQCAEAIEDLHNAYYLHRDIKPSNFAIGHASSNEQRLIFMLDFGLARKFKHSDGRLKMAREKVNFRGTVRYAPLATHRLEELCRRDDLESWLYMIVELIVGRLPWHSLVGSGATSRSDVHGAKQDCRKKTSDGRPSLFVRGPPSSTNSQCPTQFDKLLIYVDKLQFWTIPDYSFFTNQLRLAMTSNNIDDSMPYDWEVDGEPKSP